MFEVELEFEEADQPKGLRKVYAPTKEEYANRCRSELLADRNWCPRFVKAKRKNAGHHQRGGHVQHGVPAMSADYMYFNEKGDFHNRPAMVVHDSGSQGVRATAADNKGESECVIRRLCGIIKHLGYMKIACKSEQEPSIAEVNREVRDQAHCIAQSIAGKADVPGACQVVVQHSPVGGSAANGAIEKAIQRVQGQLRAIKLDLEAAAGFRINPSFHIWKWLIEFAAPAFLMWRLCGDDGYTANQRTRGRARTSPKARFGEKVLYKVAKTVRLGKAEVRRREGIWLGTLEILDEQLAGTYAGATKCRCISGMADIFDAKVVEEMRGYPRQPATKQIGIQRRTNTDKDDDAVVGDDFERQDAPRVAAGQGS